MPRRLGSLPLRSGDKIVFSDNGEEKKGVVKNAQKHKAVVKGAFGKATITLASENGDVVLRFDVEEKDSEGRVLLRD